MSAIIHARNTKQGMRFRIWSSVVDAYFTEAMTEAEVEQWTREEAIREAKEAHKREFSNRIARAKENGTSSLVDDVRDLNGPWNKQKKV